MSRLRNHLAAPCTSDVFFFVVILPVAFFLKFIGHGLGHVRLIVFGQYSIGLEHTVCIE